MAVEREEEVGELAVGEERGEIHSALGLVGWVGGWVGGMSCSLMGGWVGGWVGGWDVRWVRLLRVDRRPRLFSS